MEDRPLAAAQRRAPARVPPAGEPTARLNLGGAWEVFSHANDVLARKAYDLGVYGPAGPHITTAHGLEVGNVRPLPRTLTTAPHVVVVVAGGHAFTDPSEHDWAVALGLTAPGVRATLGRWRAMAGPSPERPSWWRVPRVIWALASCRR